jgi:hypothetical protein
MPPDADGLARLAVNLDDYRMQLNGAFGCFHPDGHSRQKLPQHRVFLNTDDGIERTGHTAVGLIRSAAGKNTRIGGRNVGVRAYDSRNAAIHIPPHGHLLARDLGMKIDEPDRYVRRQRGQQFVGLPERAVGVCHVNAALEIHHRAACAGGCLVNVNARTWAARRKVRRPQQARIAREIFVDVALVPDVIAGRHNVDPAAEKLVGNSRRDAETRRGILAVRDHNVNRLGLPDVGEMVRHNSPPGVAEDVADEKELHVNGGVSCRGEMSL